VPGKLWFALELVLDGLLAQELEPKSRIPFGTDPGGGAKGDQEEDHPFAGPEDGIGHVGVYPIRHPERLQIIGNTEATYFKTLTPEMQEKVIHQICSLPLSCLVVTRGLEIPELLLREAEERGIPVFRTNLRSIDFIERITKFLEEKLASTSSLHGVLMDVYGVGVLILGKSGIGKSECALDLILRGHRLVADDMVHIRKRSPSSVIGSGFEVIQHHMEIRGLGIINIRSLFGVEAIREKKKIELVLELGEWDTHQEYDRLGFEEEKLSILDVELPMMRIPVTPARNLTTIIEVAVRNSSFESHGIRFGVGI